MGPYLHSVNIKTPRQEYCADPDTGRLVHKPVWVPLRDGLLDLPLVLKRLDDVGYSDALSLHAEYRTHYHLIETDRDATTALIKEDLAYLRDAMSR